jgi:hypothetical protein
MEEAILIFSDTVEKFGKKISIDNYKIMIDLCSNEFEYMAEIGERSMIFHDITRFFNLLFIEKKIFIPESALDLFNYILKNYEEFELNDEADSTITNCLEFLTFMCKHDISFVYIQRNELFDYLDKMHDKLSKSLNENRCGHSHSNYYAMAGLNLIDNLIKNWSFEIYILLDRNGINAFIDRCKQSLYEEEYYYKIEIKLMANNISNQIFNYKASLRRFFIMNGYPKKLT